MYFDDLLVQGIQKNGAAKIKTKEDGPAQTEVLIRFKLEDFIVPNDIKHNNINVF